MDDDKEEPVGFKCPGCGEPPVMAFAEQAFCGTETCPIVAWNPTKTMDGLLDDWQQIDLGGLG